ncbi:MAG: sigma-70 family RNA polymerase sigma factor, partial [Planctomycetes bacterium]|nr:sigma-70 family RNA polymerase sigma factor [Planctomycetota bacterium]
EKAKKEGREAPSMVSLPTDESGNELLGCEAPEASCENSELMDMMRSAMQELPEKMRIVMTLYYGESQSMRMIGERLNLTESRVSQIHSNAVARMRRRMNGKG